MSKSRAESKMKRFTLEESKIGEVTVYQTKDMEDEINNRTIDGDPDLRPDPRHKKLYHDIHTTDVMKTIARIYSDGLPGLLNANSRLTGLERIAALDAHGDFKDGKWVFIEKGEKTRAVEEWLNRVSKKYNMVLLCCCNPGNLDLQSKGPLLIYPDDSMLIRSHGAPISECSFRYCTPVNGVFDDYGIEWVTARLNDLADHLAEKAAEGTRNSL